MLERMKLENLEHQAKGRAPMPTNEELSRWLEAVASTGDKRAIAALRCSRADSEPGAVRARTGKEGNVFRSAFTKALHAHQDFERATANCSEPR